MLAKQQSKRLTIYKNIKLTFLVMTFESHAQTTAKQNVTLLLYS